jgi:hypothetical protein
VQRGNVEYECSIPHCIFTSCNRVASLVSSAIHVRATKFTFVIRQFNPRHRCRQQATVENRQVTTCAMVATMLAFFARLFLGWPISVRSHCIGNFACRIQPSRRQPYSTRRLKGGCGRAACRRASTSRNSGRRHIWYSHAGRNSAIRESAIREEEHCPGNV